MGLSNYLPSSRISQSGVCTSTTRPASPYEGQMIYETDTNRVLVYDNTAWVMIADTDTPPGLQLIKSQTATSGTVINVTDCFSSDFENYRVVVNSFRTSSSASGLVLQLGTGSAVNTAYYWAGLYFTSYTGSPVLASHGGSNVSSFETPVVGGTSTDGGGVIEILAPNLARQTSLISTGVDGRTDGAPRQTYSGFQNSTTQFTSLHLTSSSSISNCTVRVYGYRN